VKKTAKQLDAEIASALVGSTPQRRELTKVIDPKDLCAYCGKPTRKGSMLLDEGQTAHRSCYKEFENGE
jgi:hypothetical protein